MKRLSLNEIEEAMEESMSNNDVITAQAALEEAEAESKAAKKKVDEARLHLHEVHAAQPSAPAPEVKHPGRVNLSIQNDYRNSPGRWNGPDTSKRPAALTPAELKKLNDDAKAREVPVLTVPEIAARRAAASRRREGLD